ncbi:MAG TPA: hypothetical protein VJB62_01855 [Patescibacteria group bacterium]|nr:hypothetical protein [Patescibacteria group bacterium]
MKQNCHWADDDEINYRHDNDGLNAADFNQQRFNRLPDEIYHDRILYHSQSL